MSLLNPIDCIVLYPLFILLSRRKAAEALYVGQQLPRLALGNTEILLSDLNFFLIEIDVDCNLVLLVEPPSRGNYRKVPFPSPQQHNHG